MPKTDNIKVLWLVTLICISVLMGCETTRQQQSALKQAESYNPAECYYSKDEITQFRQRAESGDRHAQYLIAHWYNGGVCSPQDTPKAIKWYSRAAEQGDTLAVTRLEYIFFKDSQGVSMDFDEAVKWYRVAAEQGNYYASHMLGDVYFQNKYAPQDLDEAEKWYRLAGEQGDPLSRSLLEDVLIEKDPTAWKKEEQERIAQAEERQRKREEREAEESRIQTKETAQKVIARFGLVSVSVIEDKESKQVRTEVRKKLKSLPESPSKTKDIPGNELLGGILYSILVAGPFGPPLVLWEATRTGSEKKQQLSSEEKREIKTDIAALTKTFAQAEPEKDLKTELLATAARQQAPNLLVSDSNVQASTASDHLEVQFDGLQLVSMPSNTRLGRLWVATAVKLDRRLEKRVCYMGDGFSLTDAAENGVAELRKRLDKAYRSLSNQIVSEVLGLAPDPEVLSPSSDTRKWCESAITPVKVAGGHYTGEMKDGKRHGYGEMHYQTGDWVSIYRGRFENDKEEGIGRCKYKTGRWDSCTFANGKRI